MNKAIFWDSDGTLLYGNESFKISLVRAFKTYGYELDEEESKNFMRGVCSWYVPEKDHSNKNGEEWWQDLLAEIKNFCKSKSVAENDVGKICLQFRKNVVDYEYSLYDDSLTVLEHFYNKGYKNYIISNNFPELSEVFIKLGAGKFISGYITSAQAGYEKPALQIFEYAKNFAGNPEVCYMIGDNPKTDYAGGKAAGMKPVLVHNSNADCDICCETLIELIDNIK